MTRRSSGRPPRKFLTEQVPVEAVRRLRHDPAGFDPKYWQRGAELGWTSLLVSEEQGGGTISGTGLVDLTLDRLRVRQRTPPPGPLIPTNVVAAALERGWRRGALQTSSDEHRWPAPRSPPGARRGGPARRARATSTLSGPGRRRRAGPQRRQAAGRVRRRRPYHLLVTGRHRRRPDPGAGPGGHGRRDDHADADRSTSPGGSPSVTFRRRAGAAGRRSWGRLGEAADAGRATAAARHRDGQRRVGRRDADRLRHDRPVGLRPLLLRPAAGVLPGAQAPVRRHDESWLEGATRISDAAAAAVDAGSPTRRNWSAPPRRSSASTAPS